LTRITALVSQDLSPQSLEAPSLFRWSAPRIRIKAMPLRGGLRPALTRLQGRDTVVHLGKKFAADFPKISNFKNFFENPKSHSHPGA